MTKTMKMKITLKEAKELGDKLGITWDRFDAEEFCRGMNVEFEHGLRDPQTNVTNDDLVMTAKIALAHLKEYPDYYVRLEKMEEEADEFWKNREVTKSKADIFL